MMNLVTAIYDARRNLLEALRNHPDLVGVDISHSWRSDLGLNSIYLQDIDVSDIKPVTLKEGRKRREERFEVELAVVASSFPTPEGAEDRAVFMAGSIEDLLADDTHSLNEAGNGIRWANVSAYRLSTYQIPDGFECVVEVTVSVASYLR